ncbi:hypothetical protein EG329_006507 [Mollisiaceae sp. DMI_Dod_QoI]|nr:hypothetical protein EG329_006507 [Helotiales sp. DMI_Dod_QoI]
MFAAAQEAAKQISPSSLKSDALLRLPLICLPEKYSFSQLFDEINAGNDASNQETALRMLLILNSCLSQTGRLQKDDDDGELINKLSLWTAKSVLPAGHLFANDELLEDSSSVQNQRAIHLARHRGALGLSSLSYLLQNSFAKHSNLLDPTILVSIIAFESSRDTWTMPAAQNMAQKLLSSYQAQVQSKEFIIDHVLQSFIRPLFSRSKPDTITSTGRKAMPTSAPSRKHDIGALDRASKPWRYEAPHSVTVFSWAVKYASQEIITAYWNMFIPPLLSLLDTPTTSILVRGLGTLSAFLPKFSSKLLQQTGLGEVFEGAVMPTLLYLPSITPLEESVQILPAAFEALFILVDIRFPSSTSSSTIISAPTSSGIVTTSSQTASTKPNTPDQRIAFLDRLLRKGVLMPHLHAAEHPQITTILLSSLSTLVSIMGIHTVKHLKDILPILTEVMTDPFAGARPEGLREGVRCLRSVILNAWPRIGIRSGGHGMEAIRMLVVCWKRVNEADEGDSIDEERGQILEEVQDEIKVVGRLLVKAIEAVDSGIDIKLELKPLFMVDTNLGNLFGIDVANDYSKG